MARGKRKRNRLGSSSDEEETASRDVVSLFSTTLTCKRRKRNGETPEGEVEEEEGAGSERERKRKMLSLTDERVFHPQQKMQCDVSLKRENGRIRKEENYKVINLCIDANSESDEEDEEEEEEEEEKEEEEEEVGEMYAAQKEEIIISTVAERKRRKPRKGAAQTLLPAPPTGGWYTTRRGRSHVARSPLGKERDVVRLKEVFPQHEESYLKSRLEQCCSVEEAIADILATEGRAMLMNESKPQLPRPRTALGPRC